MTTITSDALLPRIESSQPATAGAVHGGPRGLLRFEGAAVFLASTAAFIELGGGLATFALCFLLPDLAMLGYLAGPRVGAIAYNAAHSYLGPLVAAAAGFFFGVHGLLLASALWAAHVGFDRMLGYGLKYATAFGDTHLGAKGASASAKPRAS